MLNSKKNKRLNAVTQTLMFTPHIISMVSVATLFLWMMDSKNGLFNTVLSMLGLPEGTWISDPKTALWSVALVSIWKSLGYYVLLIRLLSRISLPASMRRPKWMTAQDSDILQDHASDDLSDHPFVTVVATIASFKVFDSVSIMTGGGPINATNTLVYYIYDYAYRYGKPGQACAAGVVLLIFVCLITIIQFQSASARTLSIRGMKHMKEK